MNFDIMGAIKGTIKMVLDIAILFVKIPLQIWFQYVPRPVRHVCEAMVILFSIYMLYWCYKNRYEWMKVRHNSLF